MTTGWRDLIVTSSPSAGHQEVNFEDIEDFGPRYHFKSSYLIRNSSQDSEQQKPSPISSEPIPVSVTAADEESPPPPLSPGWVIAWRDLAGRLHGGHDEPEKGVVAGCTWDGRGWQVSLSNDDRIPLRSVTSVAKLNANGEVISVWLTREHGFDGQG